MLKNWVFTEWYITVRTFSLIKWGSLSSYKCWNWSIVGNDIFQSLEETVYWMIDFVSKVSYLYNLFRKRSNQNKIEWFEWLWSDAKFKERKTRKSANSSCVNDFWLANGISSLQPITSKLLDTDVLAGEKKVNNLKNR